MNREIKFRVWDNKKKRIFYPRKMEYVPAGIWWISSGNVFKKDKFTRISNFKTPHAIPGSAGDILMQFTGLLDKNGKEIYEGDILLSKMFEERLDKWVKRKCKVFPLKNGYFQIEGLENKYWKPLLCNIIGETWTVEVIGNIFVNPELLEVKDE